jgi:hypothetical protein
MRVQYYHYQKLLRENAQASNMKGYTAIIHRHKHDSPSQREIPTFFAEPSDETCDHVRKTSDYDILIVSQ